LIFAAGTAAVTRTIVSGTAGSKPGLWLEMQAMLLQIACGSLRATKDHRQ
jgi:hypothetical protein